MLSDPITESMWILYYGSYAEEMDRLYLGLIEHRPDTVSYGFHF